MTELTNLTAAALAIATIAAFLLAIGGIRLLRAVESRRQGVLMLVAAAVLLMNVMIWTV